MSAWSRIADSPVNLALHLRATGLPTYPPLFDPDLQDTVLQDVLLKTVGQKGGVQKILSISGRP